MPLVCFCLHVVFGKSRIAASALSTKQTKEEKHFKLIMGSIKRTVVLFGPWTFVFNISATHSLPHRHTNISKPVKLPALKIAIREETERQEKERKIEENIAQ